MNAKVLIKQSILLIKTADIKFKETLRISYKEEKRKEMMAALLKYWGKVTDEAKDTRLR